MFVSTKVSISAELPNLPKRFLTKSHLPTLIWRKNLVDCFAARAFVVNLHPVKQSNNLSPIMELTTIAYFHSPFASKFGIPKQSGLVKTLEGQIVFTPEFRNADFIRGIDQFDYLWLLWEFSANPHGATSPLVRPPRLGGNQRVGVFASRSPFRPNPIGLSCVKLNSVEWNTTKGPILHIGGADLMNLTPIFDIKPYITYADSRPEARSGFVDSNPCRLLQVDIPEPMAALLTPNHLEALRQTLAQDPRPHYQDNPDKIYGMPFCNMDVRFRVNGEVLHVVEMIPLNK